MSPWTFVLRMIEEAMVDSQVLRTEGWIVVALEKM
jgi:hypothetical protein